ncbi:MAG TPA: hypothetical protein DCL73_08760 [Treponema sp.]|nr:hypothetical protein [Treponema sp.]
MQYYVVMTNFFFHAVSVIVVIGMFRCEGRSDSRRTFKDVRQFSQRGARTYGGIGAHMKMKTIACGITHISMNEALNAGGIVKISFL